ncbi:MAG: GyrI-like domain-containing protein [Prevotellaceae bacterium]|jgi:predicted transcriptional regulator YdeE|nr:GyrI-like domain-containing protein [Prevotellaceae bacterium]
MNLLLISEELWYILAAVIPCTLFLLLALYYTVGPGKNPKGRVLILKNPIHVVGVSMTTTNKTFLEDDKVLWEKFKKMDAQNLVQNKVGLLSFVSVRKNPVPGSDSWEYIIGNKVTSHDEVPKGLHWVDIPATTYISFHVKRVKNEKAWKDRILKLEDYIYNTWLPKSDFEADPDSPVREVEYHDRRNQKKMTIFYVAVRKKSGK